MYSCVQYAIFKEQAPQFLLKMEPIKNLLPLQILNLSKSIDKFNREPPHGGRQYKAFGTIYAYRKNL